MQRWQPALDASTRLPPQVTPLPSHIPFQPFMVHLCQCFRRSGECCAVHSCSVLSGSLCPHGLQPSRLLCPWGFSSKNTGLGCHALLQGIFLTQGLNPGLLHCRQILYCLNHQGSPRILEGVAYPFSGGFSWPRNRTDVSCNAGGFFTS